MHPGPDTADAPAGPDPSDGEAPHAGRAWRAAGWMLVALGVLAACGAFIEDAGASWSALYLRDGMAAGAVTAGLGFVALQTAMTVGRLTGGPRRRPLRAAPGGAGRRGADRPRHGPGPRRPVGADHPGRLRARRAGGGHPDPCGVRRLRRVPACRTVPGWRWSNWLLRIGFLLSPAADRRDRRRHQPAGRAAHRRRRRPRDARARPGAARDGGDRATP